MHSKNIEASYCSCLVSELSSEWREIATFLRGWRFGKDSLVLSTLANEDPIRGAQLHQLITQLGIQIPRSKVYEVLKIYHSFGVIKKEMQSYPEDFSNWSRAQQRRWRGENGWKGTPPSLYSIDRDALKTLIRSTATKKVSEIRDGFNNEVAKILNESTKLITFLS